MQNNREDALLFEVALSLIPKIGPSVYRNILAYTGSAKSFFEMPNGKLSKIPGIGQKMLSLRSSKDEFLRSAEDLISDCQKKSIRILTFSDPEFPQRIKSLDDCPMILFLKGNPQLNPERTLAIVGTRSATTYGKSITRKIIEDLIPYQPTIISGLAYGIDIEAHKTALTCELPTWGILGSSVDKVYPAVHKNTALQMLELGGLISEYSPGTEMHPSNFPRRNRIIAGLADAIIVVEAAQKGGALITAEIAYSYNREVFAVPGNLMSPHSEGCNNLIQSMKAGIYTGPKVLEESLSWSKEINGQNKVENPPLDISKFSPAEVKVLEIIQAQKEIEIDQLAILSNMSVSALASILLTFEFEGIIRSLPGKKYVLN